MGILLFLLILVVFAGGPIAIFVFIVFAAVQRAKARKKIVAAAEKYLNS